MSENIREELKAIYRGTTPDVCMNCGSSLEPAVIARENMNADQIISHLKSQIEQLETPEYWSLESMDYRCGWYGCIRVLLSKLQ